MKDDVITQLSDQVIALTARMQEFERKQSHSNHVLSVLDVQPSLNQPIGQ
ncbi:MAG TPA: hypothetical protein VJ729_13735 [Nitrososphaeraceae archaeon]|nr:hypothetical protein [Nitrososphaeraceae archaeon]